MRWGRGQREPTQAEVTRWDAEQSAAEASFKRFSWLLLSACLALIACAILGPAVGVLGPEVFGRGRTFGLIALAVVTLGLASLAVLCGWGLSVGGRPWKSNLAGGVTPVDIVRATVIVGGVLLLVASALLWPLWAFGAPV